MVDALSAPGQPAMRSIFNRHGQSTGNAGVPCDDLGAIELTELGQEQAREVAASWTPAPALIVTSPYTRTRQTAAPTIARFPGVPVEVRPIEEFTYLPPARWNGPRRATPIGSASRRNRVGQYVLTRVVGVSLKKKNNKTT